MQSWDSGLGWEARGVSCMERAEPPHHSSRCVLCPWEMGRGDHGQQIWFQSPCLQCLQVQGKIPASSWEGGWGGCVCVFPAVPCIILHERESPALLHPCCLLEAPPDPKSPVTPSLMDHHGNGGSSPPDSEQVWSLWGRDQDSGGCRAGIRILEDHGMRLGALGTSGQGLVPSGTNLGAGTGLL